MAADDPPASTNPSGNGAGDKRRASRDLATYELNAEGRDLQLKRLAKVKAERSDVAVKEALAALARAAEGDDNLMHKLIDCANAYCTVGEMVSALKAVWGEFQQPVVF